MERRRAAAGVESLSDRRLRAARAAIAAGQAASVVDDRLGTITLRTHQRMAVAAVHARLDAHHGCLLAEDVGRGKTFVALAVAVRWSRPLVVIPAALRDTWMSAMQRVGVEYPLVSHESLSRGAKVPSEPDGVIVDESHHFRNPATRRHGALADLAARAELLLLSATPVQNGLRDLRHQLMLILGSSAAAMTEDELARHVVRVDDAASDGLPLVADPLWVPSTVDDGAVLRAILDLPTPPRALDAGDAGALRTMGLVRAWASSRAALESALRRRRRTVTAIEQSLDAGRHPTLTELRSWRGAGDDSIQLGFAELLASAPILEASADLRAAVREEWSALEHLAALLRRADDVDAGRAEALRAIVAAHPGERVIAFTELASTARAYYAHLHRALQVAVLTANEGRIASGRVSRRELLARFAPRAQGLAEPHARERIALLISTDLLSEGVNLQDASVVVHLDIPWNPARLAQRVGRLRRPSGAARVVSFLLAPPADTELLVTIESRLRGKLSAAERAVGRGFAVVPTLTMSGVRSSVLEQAGLVELGAMLRARIAGWRDPSAVTSGTAGLIVASAAHDGHGWLATLRGGRLLGSLDDGDVGDGVALLDRLTSLAEGPGRPASDAALAAAASALNDFLAKERLLMECGAARAPTQIVRLVERRAGLLLQRSSRVARSTVLGHLGTLRRALGEPLSLGMERGLERLMLSPSGRSFEAFVAEALSIVARRTPLTASTQDGCAAVMILLGTFDRSLPR